MRNCERAFTYIEQAISHKYVVLRRTEFDEQFSIQNTIQIRDIIYQYQFQIMVAIPKIARIALKSQRYGAQEVACGLDQLDP